MFERPSELLKPADKPFFIGGDIASSGTGFGLFFPGLIDESAIYTSRSQRAGDQLDFQRRPRR